MDGVKGLEDDFVAYCIYPVDTGENLVNLRTKCLEVLEHPLSAYMWHHDAFVLNVETDHLSGKVTVGENVEDEWFIVSLLYRLSEALPIVATVRDQDGEVLLIEAADFLPKWAQEPELAEDRVYIYKGELHLIPVASSPAQLTPIPAGKPEIAGALNAVIKYPCVTIADSQIQDALRARMKDYPRDWSNLLHYCHVLLPKNLVKLAKSRPHLTSCAIRCFYGRDPIDMRASRLMKSFNPKQQGLSKTGLSLTKCLYAMLAKQNFKPDKKSEWPQILPGHVDYKASDLGAKLTIGFEILASLKTHKDDLLEAYMTSLSNKGYFENELKGSKKYNELFQKAKDHFECNNQADQIVTPSMELSEAIANFDGDVEDDKVLPEDDDSWLDIHPDSFDEMLRAHFNLKEEHSKAKDKGEIPSEIKNFLKSMSDLKGVEETKAPSQEENLESIDFNAEEFENAFKKVLGIRDESDDEDSESDIDLERDVNPGEMADYFAQMSDELKGTKVSDQDENDWERPLDIDSKLISNLLESYKHQAGLPGPASTILDQLGFDLK